MELTGAGSNAGATAGTNGPGAIYVARISTGFEGAPGRPIGSYITAVALKCMELYCKPLGYTDPISLHADFFASPPLASIAHIVLKETKRGKNYIFLNGDVTIREKDGSEKVYVACHGIFGILPEASAPQRLQEKHKRREPVPPLEACADPFPLIFGDRPRLPLKDGDPPLTEATFQLGDPAKFQQAYRVAQTGDLDALFELDNGQEWVGHPDGRPVDVFSATFFADGPPLNMLMLSQLEAKESGKAERAPSTLTLQIQYFAKPSGYKMRRTTAGGLIGEKGADAIGDVESFIWDETGEKMLVLSRQTVHIADLGHGGKKGEQASKSKM